MTLTNWVDPKRCYQLVTGIVGIYFCYLSLGILHEYLLTQHYLNDSTSQKQKFVWPIATLLGPHLLIRLILPFYRYFTVPANERVRIPSKNSALCGFTMFVAITSLSYAILYSNFPIVMMFKSCNLVSVLLVGVLCSKVRDKSLKLGAKKLIIGGIVTLGIVLFKIFDPESSRKQQKQTQIIGIVLLIVSLLADGFLPDFQAEIKTQFNPKPIQMLLEINKWVIVFSMAYACLTLQLVDIIMFVWNHRLFAIHLLLYSSCALVGQMFIYRMIKQFKQHFVPFVITTRKIFTVGLSIVWYGHETNIWQLLGLVLVFGSVTYEFVTELMEQKSGDSNKQQIKQIIENKETSPTDSRLQVESSEVDMEPSVMDQQQGAQKIQGQNDR